LNHLYTITKGKLIEKEKECSFSFALVFEENGVYFLETFLEDDFYEDGDFSKWFNLEGVTEKNYLIEIKDLTFTSFKHKNQKARFVCRNYIKLTKQERKLPEDEQDKEQSIFFLELEGFKTAFSDYTDIKKQRRYGEIDKFNGPNFDHTSCSMSIEMDGYEQNYFHLIFSKSNNSENIQIDFTENGGYGRLTYNHYLDFRNQLISFLSFLNGGQVQIRKELTGDFYRTDGSDAHIVYLYSYSKIENSNLSRYVLINDHHSYSSQIFQEAFFKCFNLYYQYDKSLELTSTVTSLNQAFTTSGIQQSYSILINALEKLCSNYQNSIEEVSENLIDNHIWNENIKPSLIEILDANKAKINSTNKNAFSIFKSKIGDINRRKNSTVEKMFDLLEFGSIPRNDNVENLVNQERHNAVHNGIIGDNPRDMYTNLQKLDHILRDLILNIIDYRKLRNPLYEYATKEEKISAYPKKELKTPNLYRSEPLRRE
jgi:hypothetical protein